MKISKQARRGAKQLFRVCFQNGLLDEDRVRETVSRVIELKPRGYIQILSHFQRLVKLDVERRNARIESAVPLAPDLQDGIRQKLTGLYGPGLSFNFSHNPSLLGGVRIKVGSDVYDGSVQARLNQLQEQFS
jgi:F-type H+-transporting ATPase subunit delta